MGWGREGVRGKAVWAACLRGTASQALRCTAVRRDLVLSDHTHAAA